MLIRVSSNCKTHNECTKKWATKSGLQKVGCDECDRDACGWVGETQKKRLKCEIWEKWGATYGRNGWGCGTRLIGDAGRRTLSLMVSLRCSRRRRKPAVATPLSDPPSLSEGGGLLTPPLLSEGGGGLTPPFVSPLSKRMSLLRWVGSRWGGGRGGGVVGVRWA